MRIIHCSDIHLGSSMQTHLDKECAHKRQDQILASFLRLIDYAKQENVDAILIAGDLMDSYNGNLKTRNTVLDAINTAKEVEFYYLCGNHDENSLILQSSEIPSNLHTFNSEKWISYKLQEITITGAILGDNNSTLYPNLQLDKNSFNIVLLHGGIVSGNQINTPDTVNIDLLKNKNIDYLALGHYHTFQQGQLDQNATYAYSGCLEGRGFDECGDKGFILLDINDKQVSAQFIVWGKTKFYEVNIDITNITNYSDIKSAILQKAKIAKNNDFVRVILVGEYTEKTQKHLSLLQAELKDNWEFLQIKDHSTPHLDLGQIEQEISLAGEFVRQVRATELSRQTQDEIILCGLRALNGEEVLQ